MALVQQHNGGAGTVKLSFVIFALENSKYFLRDFAADAKHDLLRFTKVLFICTDSMNIY